MRVEYLVETIANAHCGVERKTASPTKYKSAKSIHGIQALKYQEKSRLSSNEVSHELERTTPQRAQAVEKGMLRPFLLLVSMHPEHRKRWALDLGVVLTKKVRGDSHAEAYYIICHGRIGTPKIAHHRDSECMNWNTLLSTTIREELHTFTSEVKIKHKIEKQQNGVYEAQPARSRAQRKSVSSETSVVLEDMLLSNILSLMREQLGEKFISSDKSPRSTSISETLQQVGQFRDELLLSTLASGLVLDSDCKDEILNHLKRTRLSKEKNNAVKEAILTVSRFFASNGLPVADLDDTKMFNNVFNAYSRPQNKEALPFLTACILQRASLAMIGINIEDYYARNFQ